MVRALISSSGCIVIRYTLYVETGGGEDTGVSVGSVESGTIGDQSHSLLGREGKTHGSQSEEDGEDVVHTGTIRFGGDRGVTVVSR